jgi:hypothetical protein
MWLLMWTATWKMTEDHVASSVDDDVASNVDDDVATVLAQHINIMTHHSPV